MSKRDALPLATTHEVRDNCLCLRVWRAARALARRYDEALKPAGLTHGQFSLMMSLNRVEPPTIGDVAALLAMDRTTVTANLKPLEKRRLVRVTADKADRRTRRMALTAAGRKLLAAALPLWRREQMVTARLVPGGDTDRLRSDLRALT
jgi:DNA-binding MarR family transcriptional regulator